VRDVRRKLNQPQSLRRDVEHAAEVVLIGRKSEDGLSLYLASNRPGGRGGLDIWVATRSSSGAAWGAPQNLGEPVNSAADDFCPTPVGKGGLFFVSREALPGACGQGDIIVCEAPRGTP